MGRLHDELFAVQLLFGFLLAVGMATVAVTALLAWRLFAPFGRTLSVNVLVSTGASAQTVAAYALRGRLVGSPVASSDAGRRSIDPGAAVRTLRLANNWFAYSWETARAWLGLLSSLFWLTATVSAWSTLHEFAPSFTIEYSNRSISVGQALYGVVNVLAARLTVAAALCAALGLISGTFHFCLRRRRAEWALLYCLAIQEWVPDDDGATGSQSAPPSSPSHP